MSVIWIYNNAMEFKTFLESNGDFELLKLYRQNVPVRDISQVTGKTFGGIYRTLNKYEIGPNRQGKHEDVLKYANMGCFTVAEIAELSGCTPRNVRYILSKQSKLNE